MLKIKREFHHIFQVCYIFSIDVSKKKKVYFGFITENERVQNLKLSVYTAGLSISWEEAEF